MYHVIREIDDDSQMHRKSSRIVVSIRSSWLPSWHFSFPIIRRSLVSRMFQRLLANVSLLLSLIGDRKEVEQNHSGQECEKKYRGQNAVLNRTR